MYNVQFTYKYLYTYVYILSGRRKIHSKLSYHSLSPLLHRILDLVFKRRRFAEYLQKEFRELSREAPGLTTRVADPEGFTRIRLSRKNEKKNQIRISIKNRIRLWEKKPIRIRTWRNPDPESFDWMDPDPYDHINDLNWCP